jgi:hypothetical protein
MTLGFQTILTKILACIPIYRYKKIGTICINDTCLQIPLATARDHQNQSLESSPVAHPQIDETTTKTSYRDTLLEAFC